MALTITENFRMTAGGRAFRCFEVVHDSGTTKELTAASIDLDYIQAIVGVNTRMSFVAVASNLLGVLRISIAADHKSILWASSGVCTQDITIVGW
jgi:hypothetical protein